ncbi:MAG: MerC domain-containing protein [Puniceicoccales bacterium]
MSLSVSPVSPSFTTVLRDAFWANGDRLGVIASTLCAVHCAVTPVLVLTLPALGNWWAHPAAHWVAALFVAPLALVMLYSGFRKHRRRWIIASGMLGICLVLLGAAAPSLSSLSGGEDVDSAVGGGVACADACCPSVESLASGEGFSLSAASAFTALGGVLLVVAHLGNRCRCKSCGSR